MKKILLILIILLTGIGSLSYGQDNMQTDKAKAPADQTIEVYYFHMSRRCPTCLAVESESETALKNLYPGQMESGQITFKSLNLEEEINEPLAKKLQVSGQTLLIVKGDKKIDMTGDGFTYARTNPEKLQEKFKTAIDPLL
jgi:hypothetical protein